ncbi:MAG: porin family protein [Bacteroidota bacterium]
MKHLIGTFVILLIAASSLHAQGNSFFIGANAGTNFSKYKFTEDLQELYTRSSRSTGINGGFTAGLQLQNFTLTTGIQYMQKGAKYETDNFTDTEGTGFFTADEKLHFISIPVVVGYRLPLDYSFGLMLNMGPSFNLGLSGKVDEITEYFGSEDQSIENFTILFGNGVNEEYRPVQVGFQFSPGFYVNINENSKITFNATWDSGLNDAFNSRYKEANSFFDVNKGKQFFRSTVLTLGYEYHISFSDQY